MTEENVVRDGLIALYKFENADNSISGVGLPGKLKRVTTKNREKFNINTDLTDFSSSNFISGGKYGKYMSNTVDAITPDLNIDVINDDFTICFWNRGTAGYNSYITTYTPYRSTSNLVEPFYFFSDSRKGSGIDVIFFIGNRQIKRNVNFTNDYLGWHFYAITKRGSRYYFTHDNSTVEIIPGPFPSGRDYSQIDRMRLVFGGIIRPNLDYYNITVSRIDSFRVYNRALSASDLENIRTLSVSTPPVFLSFLKLRKSFSIVRGSNLSIYVTARDPDEEVVSFQYQKVGSNWGSVSNNKTRWNTVNTNNSLKNGSGLTHFYYNTFHFLTSGVSAGRYLLRFVATSASGEQTTITITIIVSNPIVTNSAPVLTNPGNQSVIVGSTLRINLSASDPNNDVINYSLPTRQAGMSIDSKSGVISWTPTATGTFPVIARASDPDGLFDDESFNVVVNPKPVVNASPPTLGSIGNKYITAGDNLVIQLSATDDDENVTFVYGRQTGGGFSGIGSLNTSTGRFVYNNASTGVYRLKFTVTARGGNPNNETDEEIITVTVKAPPVVNPTPPVLEDIPNQSVRVGHDLVFDVTASDPDNLPLTFTTTNSSVVIGNQRSVNRSGIIYRTVSMTWRNVPRGFNNRHSFNVKVTANGGEIDDQDVVVVTSDNNPPVLIKPSNRSVRIGQVLGIDLSASDLDGDDLSFSYSPRLSGSSLSGNRFSYRPSSTSGSPHTVRFTVNDGNGGTDYKDVVIHVLQRSTPPVLLNIENQTVGTGGNFELKIRAYDPDNNEITFSVSGGDGIELGDVVSVRSGSRIYRDVVLKWDNVPRGNHRITVGVRAGGESGSNRVFTINATTNRIPTINVIEDKSVLSGQTLRFTVNGIDPDGDPLRYVISDGFLIGMLLDRDSGEFVWTPTEITPGGSNEIYEVEFQVIDSLGSRSAKQSVNITVVAPSVVESDEGQGVNDIFVGQVIVYDDNNSDNIADWTHIISRDYTVRGNMVLDNGIIRVVIGKVVDFKQVISVFRINREDNSNEREIFTITPIDDKLRIVSDLNSIVFRNFNINQVIAVVRYGETVYEIMLGRGMPYCNITSNRKSIAIHRNIYSDVKRGSQNYVESLFVPVFGADYVDYDAGEQDPGFNHNYSEFKNWYGDNNTDERKNYVRSALATIYSLYSNYILWGVQHGDDEDNKYANVMCFVTTPIRIVRSDSELTGEGGYPDEEFIKNLISFKYEFRVALIDIPSNFNETNDSISDFIELTDEACQRVFERNFLRRLE